jgi:DNA-binding beta-propeller fold protein YncE
MMGMQNIHAAHLQMIIWTLAISYPGVHGASAGSSCAVYVMDYTKSNIEVIDPTARKISTFAGNGSTNYQDGKIDQAIFAGGPCGTVVSSDGSRMYVAEYRPARVRMINIAAKTVSTLAGSGENANVDGVGSNASFDGLESIALSPDDRTLYVVDRSNHRIRKIDVVTGAVTPLAGSSSGSSGLQDGVGSDALFGTPVGLAISPDGKTLYVSEVDNKCIRKINITGSVTVSSLTSCDPSAVTNFSSPNGVAASPDGETLFVTDSSLYKVFKVTISTGVVAVLSGNGSTGSADGASGMAMFNYPYGVSITQDGSLLYVADWPSSVRAVNTQNGAVSTLAWNGADESKTGGAINATFGEVYYTATYCNKTVPVTTSITVPAATTTKLTSITTPAATTTATAGNASKISANATSAGHRSTGSSCLQFEWAVASLAAATLAAATIAAIA